MREKDALTPPPHFCSFSAPLSLSPTRKIHSPIDFWSVISSLTKLPCKRGGDISPAKLRKSLLPLPGARDTPTLILNLLARGAGFLCFARSRRIMPRIYWSNWDFTWILNWIWNIFEFLKIYQKILSTIFKQQPILLNQNFFENIFSIFPPTTTNFHNESTPAEMLSSRCKNGNICVLLSAEIIRAKWALEWSARPGVQSHRTKRFRRVRRRQIYDARWARPDARKNNNALKNVLLRSWKITGLTVISGAQYSSNPFL